MTRFRANTRLQCYIDTISEHQEETRKPRACQEAIDYCRKQGDISLVSGARALPEHKHGWSAWVISHWGKEMDNDTRMAFIENVKDPMLALSLYLRLPFLTDEEDKVLESVFRGKLPRAEKELAEGVVSRAKES